MQKKPVHPQLIAIRDFTYPLPEDKIARFPLEQRDASKLLIYNGKITEDTYHNLAAHIPPGALLVFNQTKVVNARLLFRKSTGGKVEVFCLEPDSRYPDIQNAMLQPGTVYWKCLVGGAAKWKTGQVLTLPLPQQYLEVKAEIVERQEGYFLLKIYWDTALSFAEILHFAGVIPLPPYLNRDADENDQVRYQTIFAKEEGSVAAPTAALHFTEHVLGNLKKKGCETALLTLHVGAGTFMPVKADTMQGHDMHAEWIDIEQELLDKIIATKQKGNKIVATGTTSARTLESLYWLGVRILNEENLDLSGIGVPQWYPYDCPSDIKLTEAIQALSGYMVRNKLPRIITKTQIIIAPGYIFRVIDGLITNFHQPQSTLLLLVAAITGNSWHDIYTYALNNEFRFLSYGDGSLLWI